MLKKTKKTPIQQNKHPKPSVKEQPKDKEPQAPITINIGKIAKIESNNNPKAVNKKSGARGLCQIMKQTWEEATQKLGVDWKWDEAFDKSKNIQVANYYFNTEIPRLLKHFKIPDTLETRLSVYNWGIGNLVRVYRKDNDGWVDDLPSETKNYIKKYLSI